MLSSVLVLVLALALTRGLLPLEGRTEGVKRVLAKPRSWSAIASIEWYIYRWAKRLIGVSEFNSKGRLDD